MKKRIELEAALKQHETAEQPTTVVHTAKASAPVSISPNAAITSTVVPEAEAVLSQTAAPAKPAKAEPFAFADWTWLNGNSRVKDPPFDTKFFTPEVQADVDYIVDFNHPKDDTIGGSSEVFRAYEVQLTQLGVGGDFHFDNVRGRLMTQFGMYSTTTPRNDASPARGQWQLADAYRYVSEAYGGYHFNVLHGINVDAGIFMSYIGLFSYYNADNWAYQPSYVSSNTPWFFNGVRVQIFPSEHLKIEPWFINGWQSYGRFNNRPGIGAQILWRPNGKFEILGNQYILGEDTLNVPGRVRYHTDDSIEYKYYENPQNFLSQAAFSLTGDMGCEHGGGVSCAGDSAKGPKQDFLGFMLYNRRGSTRTFTASHWAAAKLTIRDAIWCCCRRSMARLLHRGRPISPRTRATLTRLGTHPRLSITCQASTLRSVGSSITGRRTCRISRDEAALRLRVATLEPRAR